jgi:hypothetical protein
LRYRGAQKKVGF